MRHRGDKTDAGEGDKLAEQQRQNSLVRAGRAGVTPR
jgi:hypothetical protein